MMHRQLAAVLAVASTLPGLAPAVAFAGAGFSESGPDLPVQRRATNQSPKGYAPSAVECPADRPKIRLGSTLSPQEQEWLPLRRNQTIAPIRDFLKRMAIPGFDSNSYLAHVEDDATALPNIGLAFSGGGLRGMLNGAGAFAAWDDRSPGSTDSGNLGGLLQSATYISSLSGGSWLVGSIYTNNFTTVKDAVESRVIWQLQNSIFEGPDQYSFLDYYSQVFHSVDDKAKAGFDRTITDYWGRMLSFQLINATDGGPGFTFSSIAEDPDFAQGKTPLPFIVADGRAPGEAVISSNSTIFEFSPWEFGSHDPWLNGFAPLKYAGSNFINGSLPDNESCMVGFDNAGFVMGTSSSLFNDIILFLNQKNSTLIPSGTPDFVLKALGEILTVLGEENKDIADWSPNAFEGWNSNDPGVNSDRLFLVDGGEDLQDIPYNPLILQQRQVDVIFSLDSDADTVSGWPDGSSIIKTYERAIQKVSNGTGFPYVPGQSTFLNLGLNTKPVFFGCDATNTTGESPLVVFLPNYPYFFPSNISTFTLSVEEDERNAIITNGWAVATQANSTRDSQWPICVGCAMLSRSFDRTKTAVPDACAKCFEQYCWNGTLDESTPADYEPQLFGPEIKVRASSAAGRHTASSAVSMAISALVSAVLSL